VALLIFLAAAARAWTVSANLIGMCGSDLIAFIDFCHEVNLPSRRATKRKGRLLLVVGYRKVACPDDIHTYHDIYSLMEGYFRNPHHRKHDPVREANIDQMAGGGEVATTNPHIGCSDFGKL
jgi:hypothetical protein